tara:strand:- start:250 stop:351 length:102 start_codon:yes stop_codon:yes gene_type:complete
MRLLDKLLEEVKQKIARREEKLKVFEEGLASGD